jgi:hypothetical protein
MRFMFCAMIVRASSSGNASRIATPPEELTRGRRVPTWIDRPFSGVLPTRAAHTKSPPLRR